MLVKITTMILLLNFLEICGILFLSGFVLTVFFIWVCIRDAMDFDDKGEYETKPEKEDFDIPNQMVDETVIFPEVY